MAKSANVRVAFDMTAINEQIRGVRRSVRRMQIAQGIPLHRNDRPVDACSLVVIERFRTENACTPSNSGACADYPPRHAAARAVTE